MERRPKCTNFQCITTIYHFFFFSFLGKITIYHPKLYTILRFAPKTIRMYTLQSKLFHNAWGSFAGHPCIVVHDIKLVVLRDGKIISVGYVRLFSDITGNKSNIGSKLKLQYGLAKNYVFSLQPALACELVSENIFQAIIAAIA